MSQKTSWVQGATGGRAYRWTTDRRVDLATGTVTHSFLHVPDCPYPLLGRDLLTKLGAQINFKDQEITVTGPQGKSLCILTLKLENEYKLHEAIRKTETNKEGTPPYMERWMTEFPDAWTETVAWDCQCNSHQYTSTRTTKGYCRARPRPKRKPCAQVNAGRLKLPQGARAQGHRPGIQWEIDFTEVKPGLYDYKYLLVFVDTFSGWVEAYPTKNETATTVVKKLLEEIFPRYGLPQVLGSDNGPAFASQAHLQALRAVREYIWKPLAEAYKDKDIPPCPHPFKEGDQVYVRRHQAKTLEPRWKGPFTVLLTTPTALKVDGIAAWVHASHVKHAKDQPATGTTGTDQEPEWKLQRTPNPLKIRLTRA
ncbi:uncharacterized protein LOC121160747 [Ochotona curzoniae]|uniref:uncharacterized protein LOC121160747 n=1 Tax=Ochotona curzoniae TaxID=130825 RepID=UPI001B34E33A|nr:uncharacterized protein LOC121160747 [Ochotona curzoniae]